MDINEVVEQPNVSIKEQRQLLKTANLRISHLAESAQKIQEKIQGLEQEKLVFIEKKQARQDALTAAKQALDQAQQEQELAQEHYSIAEGQGGKIEKQKRTLWQEATFALNNANISHDGLVVDTEKRNVQDGKELQSLDRAIAKERSLLASNEKQIGTFSTARNQIAEQLDQALFVEQVNILKQSLEGIGTLTLELVARADAHDALSKTALAALAALAHSPELQAQARALCSYRDDTVFILETAINLCHTLLNQGYNADKPLENIIYRVTPYRSLGELLSMNFDDIAVAFHRQVPPMALQDQLKQLEQVKASYVQEKLGG
jgi:hypothetical protein